MAFRTIPTAYSSNIALNGVSYEDDSKTLRIVFLRNQRTYSYSGVDVKTAEGFSRASSPGNYFRAYILNQYGYAEE